MVIAGVVEGVALTGIHGEEVGTTKSAFKHVAANT